jgi:uncharacterized protein YqgC (DUF456 family)
MDAGAEVVVGLVMLVGLVGVVVPVLPGLLLLWAAALVWTLAEDGTGRWLVLALVSVLCVVGAAAAYVVPGRALKEHGAPTSTLLAGAAGAVVGFFLVPVVGVVLGGVVGVFAAELARLHDRRAAWRSTWATIKGVGTGIVLQLLAGAAAFGVWVVGAVVTS